MSKDTSGTCCGAPRKEVTSTDGDGHDHNKKDMSGVCLACQGGNGAHTCGV